ncbi:MAG TPA: histone deacetylase family protein [Micropepsaceae bacterium]|jgi:acetoin utilization deacetylase AcuC-like enzyme|nr:histone deacetylase family protein [Micropepsaceae bacterium]
MTTALITHSDCLLHRPPPGHPERPERLSEVLKVLDHPDFAGLLRKAAPMASEGALMRVHDPDIVTAILEAMPEVGYVQIDSDTIASPGTKEAILRAAGAVILGVDMVMTGEAKNVFCAVRPPGHHATPRRAMGFCFFNSVAVGALHARAAHGLTNVAVVDFDVHHGNGTQAAFTPDPHLFYASTHQSPLYPGTGSADETGIAHNVVNAPLPPGAGGPEFRRAFEREILPALAAFQPELVIISAGFDAHRDDPLAQLRLDETDFAWATEAICRIAKQSCEGRVVSSLEGGYDLSATARSAGAHVRALMAA